jgi:cytochrome d ubiquinol oxidase subunit II
VLWPLLTVVTWLVNAPMLAALPGRPLAWLSVLLAIAGLVGVRRGLRADRPLAAFLGSCAFLAGMLAATAVCVFPVMLRAIEAGGASLTAHNASVPASSLVTALGWWVIGAPLAVLYLVILFRLHRGKVASVRGREGY